MATDVTASGADEPEDRRPPQRNQQPQQSQHGFFTIYKKGQGYWTRIGSAAGAGLILLLTAQFLYAQLPAQIAWFNDRGHPGRLWGVVVGFIVASAVGTWMLMNRPGNVDFLIATDSEMKKVNWTSRRELIGSTKVVIFFMFMIAAFLFLLDMYFTRMFYLVGVLAADAPMWEYIAMLAARWHLPVGPVKVLFDILITAILVAGSTWAVYGTAKSK